MNTEISESEQLYWGIFEATSDGILITDLETGSVLFANSAAAKMHGYERESFIGLRLQSLIHANNRPFFDSFAQVIQQNGLFELLADHVRKDNSTISVEWRAVAFAYQGRACALAVIRDVTKRVQAERQLRQRMGMREREQATLLEISQTLASTLELRPSLILDQLRVLIKYTHASLFTLEDSTLVALAVRGTKQLEQTTPIRVRLNGKKTLEALFNGHQPIRIADMWGDDPQAHFLRSLLDNGAAGLLEGMQSWMWVPLAVKNRIIGGVGLAHEKLDYFTHHHADLALSVANQAAITMINAELYEDAQALGVVEERQHLARNLHDAINQSLFSAGLIAEVLPRLWERDQDEARKSLEDLRRLTRGAMAEMRALLAELRPSTLTDADLGDLLRLLGNAFTGRTNIPAKVSVVGEGVLPAETQVALYRICQEALNNVAKHALASQVDLALKHEEAGIELSLRDDGLGFDPGQATTSGHYGLSMMRERAEAVGARLSITSQPGHGTKLTIHWTGDVGKEAK